MGSSVLSQEALYGITYLVGTVAVEQKSKGMRLAWAFVSLVVPVMFGLANAAQRHSTSPYP